MYTGKYLSETSTYSLWRNLCILSYLSFKKQVRGLSLDAKELRKNVDEFFDVRPLKTFSVALECFA